MIRWRVALSLNGHWKKYPSLQGVCADAGYRKTFEAAGADLGRTVDISERIKSAGGQILPKRWRVERTFGWMNGSRRLSKDYEITTNTNLPLKGRKDLRGIIVPDKAEDAGELSPGKDDNAVWRNKTRKAFDDLMED